MSSNFSSSSPSWEQMSVDANKFKALESDRSFQLIGKYIELVKLLIQGYESYAETIIANRHILAGSSTPNTFAHTEPVRCQAVCAELKTIGQDLVSLQLLCIAAGNVSPAVVHEELMSTMHQKLADYEQALLESHVFWKLNYTLASKSAVH